jgi:hypothetical protein
MHFILFYIICNIKQIARELNLPLNFAPTQCSEISGA